MKTKVVLVLVFSFSFMYLFSQSNKSESEQSKQKLKEQVEYYKDEQKRKQELRKKIDGTILTELNFEDINGDKYTLESLKGKVVVFNFWFIQCRPCVEEFPDLNKLKAEFKNQPVEFFAVSWNDKKSLQKFLKIKKLDYTVVHSGRKLIDKFKIPHYPYHMIIDKNGKVEYINEVLSLNLMNKIKRKVKRLL